MDAKTRLIQKTASGGLTANARRASATIKPSSGYPSGRFPMPDAKHAALALEFLPNAKNLSPGQRSQIAARAHGILG